MGIKGSVYSQATDFCLSIFRQYIKIKYVVIIAVPEPKKHGEIFIYNDPETVANGAGN